MNRSLLLVTMVASLFARSAWAQVEVPMTPTPTPTAVPAVSPIPMYPEKPATPATTPAPVAGGDSAVRVDSAGMFGVGGMIGNTSTGANAKIWFGEDVAAQFSAGAGPFGNNLRFQFDLIYVFNRIEGEENKYAMLFYGGVGGQASIYFKHPWPSDRTDVGVRVPLGMSIVVPDNPVEIFFEVAPDVAVYNDEFDDEDHVVFFVDGQIGVRYYF